MRLLTYNEFKNIADFSQDSNDVRFEKIINITEKIYLADLIGVNLVEKLKEKEYSELLDLVKICLAKEIERYFIETATTRLSNEGLNERQSEFSNKASIKDKEYKSNNVVNQLKRYESRLISLIKAGDYPEYNDNDKTSQNKGFTITPVG